MKKQSGLSGLKNIGPTIEKRLNEIGVYNRQDLKRVGAAGAYRKIRAKYPNKMIPVCYYLYSFEGALAWKHWDDLPQGVKDRLRREGKA
ncbi:MAG TPA: TfoX/Sxy family protein [Nitrososphaera sp.]|nr:TfoX/Sxy family protein [Nitrososphaera sp.]